MKYIMAYVENRDPDLGRYVPLIFPEVVVHSVAAEYFRWMLNVSLEVNANTISIVSAGFITDDFECYGKSESLRLSSYPEDTTIIQCYEYRHGLNYDTPGERA